MEQRLGQQHNHETHHRDSVLVILVLTVVGGLNYRDARFPHQVFVGTAEILGLDTGWKGHNSEAWLEEEQRDGLHQT